MSDQVNVRDLEVFARFRAAMLKFSQAASQSLSSAESEIARTRSWLETEQRTFWEGQLRKRMEAVANARELLRQKKLYRDAGGRTPSAAEEEKALAKCLAAVEHARERIESIRKWIPRLEKAAGLYHGSVSGLGRVVADDIPRSVALLDRLASSLEEYIQIETSGGGMPETAATLPEEASVARGGDLEPPAPPPAQAAESPDLPPPDAPKPEATDVPH